ncbi:CBS domain-containing protein (plasmid) [Azospirillum argentinense]|uniref:Zinc metalloprotease n=1 Tax=Azospirillum argentinense TaxID=2970906 RepID=A0A4D8PLZ9_9PROT|nr:site-2 protease family protein [Azospirillum argentinense]QCN98274.1 CBS domain-containing protein [Azospirillum argentinense]
MSWSIPIGTVKGTVIRIHVTFFLFLLWIGAAYHAQGGWPAALEGVVFLSLLFLCVLLHEFGHVFAARRYGVRTPDITLLPIGGVARLERLPEKPSQELVVALAGPAVNLVIAALLYAALGGFVPAGAAEVQNAGIDVLSRLAVVNLFLALFNLIPAFPMDGGRVLRAVLASRMGYVRGTQVAASIGQAVAIGLGLLGLFGNPMLLFIALFVYLGASSEAHAVQMREITHGVVVSDAMVTRFETLPPSGVLEDAVQCLIRTTQHEFPVVDGAGTLRGVLTRDDLIRALRDRGPDTPVLEVMRPDIPVIHRHGKLEEALRLMQEKSLPAVGVDDGNGRLVGLVTPENVGEMMMVQAARHALRR